MFQYSLVTNLFLKRGIRSYVQDNKIALSDIIVCVSCLVNFYRYNNVLLKAIDLMFIINPLHTYIYLYYNIPKCNSMPFTKKIRKMKYELPKEYEELGRVFGWSNNETFRNKILLDNLYDKGELKKELGVK